MNMTHPDNEEEESASAERMPESDELQSDEAQSDEAGDGPRVGRQSGSNPNIINK